MKNAESENNFQAENVGRKNYVIWNLKYSDSIHVDVNHTDLNKFLPENLENIGSIYDANICRIEKYC